MEKEEERAGYSNPELWFVYVCVCWNESQEFIGLTYLLSTYRKTVWVSSCLFTVITSSSFAAFVYQFVSMILAAS